MNTHSRSIQLLDLVTVFRQTGDQQLTARRLGCTPQNVSARLRQAVSRGLLGPEEFRANHRRIDTITSIEVWTTILDVGKRYEDVAAALGITAQRFGRLLKRLPEGHAIQHVLVDDRHERTLQHRLEAQRAAALDRYRALCAKVGRRLSSADLQQKTGDEGRAIYAHIHRTYGGIKAFFAETGL